MRLKLRPNFGTVAKCLFVIVRREVDNWYLFIVYRFRSGIGFVLGFRPSSFFEDNLLITIYDLR